MSTSPPVVPDNDPLAHERCPLCGGRGTHDHPPYYRSGSGVVPDKPALAPRCTCTTRYVSDITGLFLHETLCPMSVPAVTDDEAATETIRAAIYRNSILDGEDTDEVTEAVVAGLRSAGFLIVHHTKET